MKKNTFSCIILDVMMPEINGFSACKKFRTISNAPIIFLSGRADEEDRIKGLTIGADDYITKPYSLRELAIRIEIHIRRYEANNQTKQELSVWEFPPLTIDIIKRKVYWNDEPISLSNKEFDILKTLAEKPGETFRFDEIGNAVWGDYLESDRRSIMVNMSRLRKKLQNYEGLENIIESVWSQGYRFTGKQ